MANLGNLAQRSAKSTSGGTWIQSAVTVATSTALTVPAGATHAIIDNSGAAPIRYRVDGGTPTAAVGNRLAAGASLTWTDPNIDYTAWLSQFRAIQESGSPTLEVGYLTYGATP